MDKQEQPEQPKVTKQPYFFPPDFSCEAETLEEAQKLYEQHLKGAHSPA